MKNKKIKLIATLAVFIPLTIVLNMFSQIVLPFLGRLDFSHLPTLVLAIVYGPWIAGINAFFSDLLGAFLRGWTPWLELSFSKAIQGVMAGHIIIAWRKKDLKSNTLLSIILFILLFFFIEFIGYSTAFYIHTQRSFAQSAPLFFVARLLKTPIMLPIWILVIRYFYNKKFIN